MLAHASISRAGACFHLSCLCAPLPVTSRVPVCSTQPAHAIPMKARKGGAPTKWVEPVTGSLRGFGTVPMEGFTFFVEHTSPSRGGLTHGLLVATDALLFRPLLSTG